MRRTCITLAVLTLALAACGGGSNESKATKSCPKTTTLTINAPGGTTSVEALTRKAVVRNYFVTVYLFSRDLKDSNSDFTKMFGSGFRIDGAGAIITEGRTKDTKAVPTTGDYIVDTNAPLQLVGYSVQADNKQVTPTPGRPPADANMKITALTDTTVCGVITGPQGSTTFAADRINATA